MPRKHADEAQQVLHMLAARGALAGVDVVALEGMTEKQVAAALRETLMFLSFGYPEGCPCPPKEAMAAGCVVVGYHGMGGRDYIRPPHAHPVDHGDIVAYARLVEELLAGDQAELERTGRAASAFVHETYSEQAERDSVLAVWGDLLAGSGARLAEAA
jgi:glycosyltransferase involved in cell wall biosynthesis